MNYHEFGREDRGAIVLIHPSVVTWDYFERVIPLLEGDYRVIVPALPGYDLSNDSEFTSVEQIASEIGEHLVQSGIGEAEAVYGCSMGGSIALRMAVDGRVKARHTILDGGITPYQLPWILTRFIALRDFCVLGLGKLGGERLMAKAFSSSQYSDEDYRYIAGVLKHCTCRTIWNTFDSCNNYAMPKTPIHPEGVVHYWYAEKEQKARKLDLKFMRIFVPDTRFKSFPGVDHGDMAAFKPEQFARELRDTIEG